MTKVADYCGGMALINGPEGLNAVSDAAVSCPHCGYPMGKPRETSGKRPTEGPEWDDWCKAYPPEVAYFQNSGGKAVAALRFLGAAFTLVEINFILIPLSMFIEIRVFRVRIPIGRLVAAYVGAMLFLGVGMYLVILRWREAFHWARRLGRFASERLGWVTVTFTGVMTLYVEEMVWFLRSIPDAHEVWYGSPLD